MRYFLIVLLLIAQPAWADRFSSILSMQNVLSKHGFYTDTIDGRMGGNTKRAMADYSKDFGGKASFETVLQTMADINFRQRIMITSKTALALLRDSAALHLRDPESATIRNVYQIQDPSISHPEIHLVCGEINGKNGYGGYVGFRYFQATEISGDYEVFLIDGPDGTSMHDLCILLHN